MSEQEKERVLVKLIKREGLEPLDNKRLLEIGCGTGINLLQLIRLGFSRKSFCQRHLMIE